MSVVVNMTLMWGSIDPPSSKRTCSSSTNTGKLRARLSCSSPIVPELSMTNTMSMKSHDPSISHGGSPVESPESVDAAVVSSSVAWPLLEGPPPVVSLAWASVVEVVEDEVPPSSSGSRT
jgi:hypothetical protein